MIFGMQRQRSDSSRSALRDGAYCVEQQRFNTIK
jgi:hypothetical protein